MIKNRSPLRAYVYKALNGGIAQRDAWMVWKIVLAPRATKRIFDAEWYACANGRYYTDEVDYSPRIRMTVGGDIA